MNSDTDSDDDDDTDDEEDLSEIVADRLAHQYEAAVEEVLAMAMRDPGENGEVLKEVCKRDYFLYQHCYLSAFVLLRCARDYFLIIIVIYQLFLYY